LAMVATERAGSFSHHRYDGLASKRKGDAPAVG
jgi:hypothetical protein